MDTGNLIYGLSWCNLLFPSARPTALLQTHKPVPSHPTEFPTRQRKRGDQSEPYASYRHEPRTLASLNRRALLALGRPERKQAGRDAQAVDPTRPKIYALGEEAFRRNSPTRALGAGGRERQQINAAGLPARTLITRAPESWGSLNLRRTSRLLRARGYGARGNANRALAG